MKDSLENIKGYGKSTSTDTGASGVPVTDGKASLVMVVVGASEDKPYMASWVDVNGSSTGGNTSGGDSGSGGSDGAGNTIDQIVKNANTWPTLTEGSGNLDFSIEKGKIYSYNGNYYISLMDSSYTSTQSYQHVPDTDEFAYSLIKIGNSSVYTSENYQQNSNQLKRGDFYRADDGSLYVVKQDITWNEPTPSGDGGSNWVKILQN